MYIFGLFEELTSDVIKFRWEVLGNELQEPRHSFISFSINTQNIMNPHSEKVVPRDRMIHKNIEQYEYFCGKDVPRKAIYCPSTHVLIITGNQVQDLKLHFGELVPSKFVYTPWPNHVESSIAKSFADPLNKYKSHGFTFQNNFGVVGGQNKDIITTRRIGYTNDKNNEKLGATQRYHINGGSAQIGNKFWMVGGRDEFEEVTFRTSLIIDGLIQAGPDLTVNGAPIPIEGSCVAPINDNVGMIAGGITSKGFTQSVLQYDFGRSLTDPYVWETLEKLPSIVFMPSCGRYEINGKAFIILVGGVTNMINSDGQKSISDVSSKTLSYNIESGTWTEIAPVPRKVYAGTTLMLEEQYFFLGGASLDQDEVPLSMEFLPPPLEAKENLTDFSGFTWNVIYDTNVTNIATEKSVILPYSICESCLLSGDLED